MSKKWMAQIVNRIRFSANFILKTVFFCSVFPAAFVLRKHIEWFVVLFVVGTTSFLFLYSRLGSANIIHTNIPSVCFL